MIVLGPMNFGERFETRIFTHMIVVFYGNLYDNVLCTICHMEDETIIHVLRDCMHAKLVWQNISPNLLRKLLTTVANVLWQTRNEILFAGEDFHCQTSCKLICHRTWQNVPPSICVVHQVRMVSHVQLIKWNAPLNSWTKVNIGALIKASDNMLLMH
ncbi:hypothetical protein CR513_20049, partial [Mucuna pruriens]